MSNNVRFIIDTNIFLDAYKKYYGFDIAPKFWTCLLGEIEKGNIIIIDKVIKELEKGDDDLSKWVCDNCNNYEYNSLSHIESYSLILNHVNDCGYYKDNALRIWADEEVADPWIIAVAKDLNCVIITNETKQNRNQNEKCKNAKIPDIANDFNIKCINIYQMLRELNITFV